MGRDSDRVPVETPTIGTNKIAMSRIEVADLFRPTTQMAPLFGDGTTDEPLVIEEHVPTPSGEHPALESRDSMPAMPIIDLRTSAMVPIEDFVSAPISARELDTVETPPLATAPTVPLAPVLPIGDAAPVAIDDHASDATVKNRSAGTSLGVAPLEPATLVKAPYVVDTPVRRWTPVARSPQGSIEPQTHPIVTPEAQGARGSTRIPTLSDAEENRHERTAMVALDPSSGMPRSGPWQALVAVAKSLGSVRWWLRRRKTSRVKPLER